MLTIKRLFMALALLPAIAQAHLHPAYSHDADTGYRNPDWMSVVPDSTPLRLMSIPGTHDTMSFYGGDIVQTQSASLPVQMESGIRYFDIRCRHIQNTFAIHHGLVYQKTMFGDVLNSMVDFLKRHPGETLLVNVQEEYTPANNSRSFEQTFAEYHTRYAGYIWLPTSQKPILGETRGKIVFVQNFAGEKTWGLKGDSFQGDNPWVLNTNWDLYNKWEKVKGNLRLAAANASTGSILNGLSGSTGAFPYFVASGHSSPGTGAPRLATGLTTPGWNGSYPDFPRVNCFWGICTIAFEGTNTLTYQYIQATRPSYVGIVVADFPGGGLIDSVLELNYRACGRWQDRGVATLGQVFIHYHAPTGRHRYFKARKTGPYAAFPGSQTSNADWQYLGEDKRCRA
ncbi:phosphatidylinositol-specific phospholipase C [Parachitinimonas caeni]|uniref:1-phosphatidylinositol phosphodiesterase n=1 Tax=Parachitinimonas caeni TaxID=3031301 RepID=A0ABT7E0C2_9NEIS|nr:phosphatidylinositol-specific phospholipase C [Parachitinimonas caeni]MDK2125765.1 phosphatidylinositol-specific phospholipase C [Parachitinimonas caeni]